MQNMEQNSVHLTLYEKRTGFSPIVASMASESQRRKDSWLKTGCNAFDSEIPMSKPMSFFTEQDVLMYLRNNQIPYASVYGDIVEENGKLRTTGEERTGCMFCPTGCHLDKVNKFQRMKVTHPKQYEYCMKDETDGGLGLGKFLDYIGVEH
jgi:3'-phosphoadenosine 5'-phosphosulfate sulfotransferase (PAPS reductase)/FAD synthetase